MGARLPLVPVDHLHGHVASLYLEPDPVEPPFLCLLASGGHTLLLDVRDRAGYRVLGTSIDDAAGEAFDKGARLLGLGYPGGAAIDRLAQEGDPEHSRSRSRGWTGLDFSFSGVKTALLYGVRDLGDAAEPRRRTSPPPTSGRSCGRSSSGRGGRRAGGPETIAVVGGVAANSELRAALPGRAVCAARSLHRQRRDDRLGGQVRQAPSLSSLP